MVWPTHKKGSARQGLNQRGLSDDDPDGSSAALRGGIAGRLPANDLRGESLGPGIGVANQARNVVLDNNHSDVAGMTIDQVAVHPSSVAGHPPTFFLSFSCEERQRPPQCLPKRHFPAT